MINDRVLKLSDIMMLGDILVTENGSQIPVIGYSGQVVSDAVNDYTNFIECRRPRKVEESPGTVPGVPAVNSQSVAALSEIVWDWLTENAVDVMVDECDVNILIQRLNAEAALHT
jgi:hypothetical protein